MKFHSSRRFVVQLIVVFMVFTLGTLLAIGVPATLLLRRQNNLQTRALIDQTNHTTQALLKEKNAQLQNLAMLLIERPTLNQLAFVEGDPEALESYLKEFLRNSDIEAITVCEPDGAIAFSGEPGPVSLCHYERSSHIALIDNEAWLLAQANLIGENNNHTSIAVGERVSTVLREFKNQSSMDYLLFQNSRAIASNDEGLLTLLKNDINPEAGSYQTIRLTDEDDNEIIFLTAAMPIGEDQDFVLIGLMNIESFLVLNRNLRNLILAAFLTVSLAGVIVANLVSGQISKPLNQLAISAASLREGDLTTPLASSAKIWELDQLTNALEDARVGLKHSLDQLRLEKLWIENMLNSIVEGILTIDEKTRITYVSKAIEQMAGFDAAQLLGRLIDAIFIAIPGEDMFSQQLPEQNQTNRISVIINGRELLLSVSISTFIPPDAGNATRALVIRDVTDEERIHRLIGEFMANITHEFRTPLSALSASVELLVDQLPDLSTQDISQLLHALNIGIVDLQSLIDNLIEAASIEGGRFKVNPSKVALNAITQASIEAVLPIAKKHGLKIHQPKTKQAFLVIADQRRTTQAVVNLLSNAIKHSPENGTITIRSLLLEKDVLIEIQDEGEGVAPERQSQLFNRFVTPQSDHDLSRIGMGLGLSVVKAIIEAQGGRVGYKNAEPHGAIFWFTLPLART